VALCAATSAHAAPGDEAAKKLRNEAIYNDYLVTDFAQAAKKLEQAVAICKAPADCSPATRARVMCDLGVIYFALKRPDDARLQFAAALREDPNVTLSNDLSTPELQREFAGSKGGGSGSAPASKEAAAAPPPGDMAHSPPPSQAVRTPIPIYVELPEGVSASKVYVRYKPFGATEWKTAHMTKVGNGYGTELPCAEVGDSTGELRYFVQATDAAGDIVASSGRITNPFRVRIVQHLEGEAPHLPGQSAPSACAATTDCPPQFPGCHATSATSSCVGDDECGEGGHCVDGTCSSEHTEVPAEYKKNWLSVAFQEDSLLLPSASNACAGNTGYTCFGGDGTYYPDLPLSGADDQVNGGLTLATMRVLFGYDRAIFPNITIGGRLGFALGGGPQRPGGGGFLPLHVEGRAAWWIGHNPLSRSGFRFFLVAAGGAAQVDASVPVDVYADASAYKSGQSQNYQAWKKTGLGFGALGPGAMYAFTPSTGIALEAKAMEMFPTAATGFGLQMAYLVGL
jgi:hypothetical protein